MDVGIGMTDTVETTVGRSIDVMIMIEVDVITVNEGGAGLDVVPEQNRNPCTDKVSDQQEYSYGNVGGETY